MTIALGLLLGAGLVLCISPWVWRRSRRRLRWPVASRFSGRFVQAGLERVGIGTVLAVSILIGALAAATTLAILGVIPLAIVAGVAASLVPSLVIGWRARARRAATRVVWPDVVDQLVSAVRSGLALPDSVTTLARSGPTITRLAFAAFEKEYRATGNFSLCLDSLKARLADPVADRILETLRMSREVGGTELTTVLRGLGAALRQEAAIRSEVQARQSWVVNAARLGVAAPWVVLLLLTTRPEAAAAYNSAAGATLIAAGMVVSLVAYRVMIALGRLPEERRWFA